MSGLARTPLATSQKVEVAVSGLASKATITELAASVGISRPTVYRAMSEAEAVLRTHFTPTKTAPAPQVTVDEAQLRRAVVALRVMAPTSIRAIEDLIPVLYPGVDISYGSVQSIASKAEAQAAALNQQADLSGISAGALDEMYSQGEPVLAGVDLDSGYLFALALRETRTTEDWAAVLSGAQGQGLALRTVVKDAAMGIARAVTNIFPDAEQRDDCFHPLYRMGGVRQQLERSAYAAMQAEQEAAETLLSAKHKLNPQGRDEIHAIGQRLNGARSIAGKKVQRHDDFERQVRRAQEAMELVDLEHGSLRDPAWMQAELESAAKVMEAHPDTRCQREGRYLRNRAPGLVLYAKELTGRLAQLADPFGADLVTLACIIWRLVHDLRLKRRPWDRHKQHRHLLAAYALLEQRGGNACQKLLEAVDGLWQRRHRASSAIEGFNAFLRPHLYVRKRVTQGFLELLRTYFNLRTRRWGRHKGTSATHVLTKRSVDDWLDLLTATSPATQPN